MKRTYECMCLLDNRDVRQGWQALKDNVATMFSKHGGEIVSARRWQERRPTCRAMNWRGNVQIG